MELKEYKLGDIAEIVNGSTPTTTCPHYYDGDIVWITPKDLSEQKSKYIEKGERNITEAGFNSCSTHLIPKYNILLTSRAPIGLLAINKVACCTNQGFKNLIVNKDIVDVDYLYYYLKYHIAEIEALGTGTTFKEVSKASMEKYTVSLPDLEEQKKVSRILSALDAKISLNRQINQNLEALARQLYDYWFVQFDFPDANGKPYKSSGGKMVYNPILKREIPEGWENIKLAELVRLEDSKRIPLSTYERENRKGIYPYYGATGIMDYIDDYLFDDEIILLAEDGSTSDEHGFPIVQYVWGKVWVNNHAHIIYPQNPNHKIYTYFMLKLIPVKLIETGSIQKKINQDNLLKYNSIKVPTNILDDFTKIVSPLWRKKMITTEEILSLTKQRDELLPLLMNGQVNFDLSDD